MFLFLYTRNGRDVERGSGGVFKKSPNSRIKCFFAMVYV